VHADLSPLAWTSDKRRGGLTCLPPAPLPPPRVLQGRESSLRTSILTLNLRPKEVNLELDRQSNHVLILRQLSGFEIRHSFKNSLMATIAIAKKWATHSIPPNKIFQLIVVVGGTKSTYI
jgi:hypothetical protein